MSVAISKFRKTKTEKLTFDADNNLKVAIAGIISLPSQVELIKIAGISLTGRDWSLDFAKLDIPLSQLARETTLSAIKNALASVGTDKLRITPIDPFPLSPINITQISGMSLTGRDWSSDFATLPDIRNTLNAIKSQTDKLNFDINNFLRFKLADTEIMLPVDLQDRWQESLLLIPPAIRGISGVGSPVDVGSFSMMEVIVDVTSVSGVSPVLNVFVEGFAQQINKWIPLPGLSSFLNITSPTTVANIISPLAWKYIRVRWEITGTSPSFEFSVSAEAKT
jgi:hypothetical protein